jgi:trimethylamine--corrinoid protein Co-methyltransferase
VQRIHQTALSILENTGLAYDESLDHLAERLQKEDVSIDKENKRIRFPRGFIEEKIADAPSKVVLYSRDGRHDLELEGDNVYFGTGGAAIKVLDLNGTVRESTLRDLYALGRIVDALDAIDFYHRPCIPRDIPAKDFDVNVFYACFKGTTKHVMAGVNDRDCLEQVVDLASLIAGDRSELIARPFFSIVASFVISPLTLNSHTVPIMLAACERKIPVALSSAPVGGMTSPVTMAGTLALLHAEELAGIALSQLWTPGAPVLYGGIPGVSEMRSMRYMTGAVEFGMMNAAIHQLSRYIDVPSYNSCGLTDAKLPDMQAGWEKALSSILVAMAGANYIHHAAGMLESMLTVGYEQYVLDNELIAMCGKALKGIPVDEEHLALETIDLVGPGGNYMTCPHTLDFMHSEILNRYGISDRSERDAWTREGSKDVRERARAITERLLENECATSCIEESVDRKIRECFSIYLE